MQNNYHFWTLLFLHCHNFFAAIYSDEHHGYLNFRKIFFNFQGSNSLFFVGIFRLPDDEKFQCCIYINCHYASHFDGSFFGLKELVFCVPRVTFDMMLARDIHSKFKCCIRSFAYKKVSVWYRRAVLIDGYRTLIYFYKYPAVLLLTWRY